MLLFLFDSVLTFTKGGNVFHDNKMWKVKKKAKITKMFLLKEFTLKPLKYLITNQLYTVIQCYRISVLYLLQI